MKNFRRWPGILSALIFLLFLSKVMSLIRDEYINTDPIIYLDEGSDVTLNVNLYMDDPGFFSPTINYEESIANRVLGTFFQSEKFVFPVLLNFIAIDSSAPSSEYCFTAFEVSESAHIPPELIQESETEPMLGVYKSGRFVLNSPLCLQRGARYFFPDIFLGFTTANAYAEFGIDRVSGDRAFQFFPFDEQRIPLDVRVDFLANGTLYIDAPNLEVFIPQDGWISDIEEGVASGKVIHLSRPQFYRVLLIASTLILVVVVLLLRKIVNAASGFFEVMFGLMVGLAALYDILLPNYIETSIPIDIFIYFLFMLVLIEIIAVSVSEYLSRVSTVKIIDVSSKQLDCMYITLENESRFPIEITNWTVSDEKGLLFQVPRYILGGRGFFSNKRKYLQVGNREVGDTDVKNPDTDYIELPDGQRIPDGPGIISLANDKGEIVFTYSYKGVQKPPEDPSPKPKANPPHRRRDSTKDSSAKPKKKVSLRKTQR